MAVGFNGPWERGELGDGRGEVEYALTWLGEDEAARAWEAFEDYFVRPTVSTDAYHAGVHRGRECALAGRCPRC